MDDRDKELLRSAIEQTNETHDRVQRLHDENNRLRSAWQDEHDKRVRLEERLNNARASETWAIKRYSDLFDAVNEAFTDWLRTWLIAQEE